MLKQLHLGPKACFSALTQMRSGEQIVERTADRGEKEGAGWDRLCVEERTGRKKFN